MYKSQHTHTRERTCSDLNHTMVDRRVLLLSQHNQGDDNDGRYDDTSYHQANYSTLVRADVFGEENLSSRMKYRRQMFNDKKEERFHRLLVERKLSPGRKLE